MADHPEDKPLENKTQSQEKPASSSLIFQDEDEDVVGFDRTINLDTPMVSSPDDYDSDSTTQYDSMESLLEEESTEPDSRTDKEDESTVVLADMVDEEDESFDIDSIIKDSAEQLGIKESSLDDENSEFTAPVKKIELTEADYVDTDAISSGAPQAVDEIPGDMPEDITEPENAIDSQAITAAANEAHALQDKPEITAEDETPEASPAKESAAPSATQPRVDLATVLALVGIIGTLGALWMIFGLSGRMDQLESQLGAMQNNRGTLNQRKDIASLNQRVDELGTQLTAHLKAIIQAKETPPAPDMKKPSAPAPVVTKPTITAIKPAMDSGHGPWVVNLISLSHSATADNEVTRLKMLGIHAESIKVMTQGRTWYRVRVPGFANAKEAERQRKILGNRLGIRDTWIGKKNKQK